MRDRGHHWKAGHVLEYIVKLATCGAAFFVTSLALSSPVVATHEADHRYTVEGFVCGSDGRPVGELKVVVKDTRASISKAAYTDGYGYYQAVLHLHNDNVGDPLLITAGDRQQHAKVRFDPKDQSTERALQVNFGEGCEHLAAVPSWIYYGAGIAGAAVVAYFGARVVRKRRRASRRRGKGGKH